MRLLLRLLALILVLATAGWWLAAGARVGWWQTRVGVEQTDEITGLTVVEWQERFVPGVETPFVGLALGAALFGATSLFRHRKSTNHQLTP